MNFLNPWGLLGLAALAPVIALYFLKLRREERVVPSTLLWKKLIHDLHVNAPFQRLRYSLLLILQMALIAGLSFALARPFLALAGTQPRAVVLLMDTSASMATRDCGPHGERTRLEQALLDAQAKVDDLARTGRMRVVAFDEEVRTLGPFTNDKTLLREQLRQLKPRDLGTHAQEALEAALALAGEADDSEVLLLSDGAFGPLDLARLLGGDSQAVNLENLPVTALRNTLRFVPYGREQSDNLGLTRVAARTYVSRAPGATVEKDLESQLLVSVENFSPEDVEALLTVTAEGYQPQTKLVKLKGREPRAPPPAGPSQAGGTPAASDPNSREASASEELFQLTGVTGVVQVRVARTSGADSLPLDNEAQVLLGAPEDLRVLLVSGGNYFVTKALLAMPEARVAKQRDPAAFQADWAARGAQSVQDYDTVVFDGVAPPEWKDGGAVFLNVLPPLEGFHAEGRAPVEWPRILDWKSDHPVLRYLTFSNLLVAKAQAWSVSQPALVLVEGVETPLVSAYDSERVRAVATAFDLFESDWAYRRSMPLLLRNAILWTGEVSPRRWPATLKTGAPLVVPPQVTALSATLLRPDGRREEVTLPAERKTSIYGTEQAGLYRLTGLPQGGDLTWAVNLTDPQESDNARRGALYLGGQEFAATPAAIATQREIWPWLVLSALGVLLLEWLVYHRRVGM